MIEQRNTRPKVITKEAFDLWRDTGRRCCGLIVREDDYWGDGCWFNGGVFCCIAVVLTLRE